MKLERQLKHKIINKITNKHMKTYYVHNNGGRPFCVHVYPDYKYLVIYRQTYNYEMEKYIIDHKIYETKYTKLFFGSKHDSSYWEKGNSILVHINEDGKNEYINIGAEVYSFKTVDNEKIVKYVSEIGNSDMIYNYAIGENNTYLLAESVRIRNKDLVSKSEVYQQYYAYRKENSKRKQGKKDNDHTVMHITEIKKKVIHERVLS